MSPRGHAGDAKDLAIGVIGAGGRGRLARLAHRPGHGSRVVACCDVDELALAASMKDYGDVLTTRDWRELLELELDAVMVCLPDFLHEEVAVAALRRGISVYLEKPMAITAAGCDRILAAADASGARLYVGHNMRCMPFVIAMKELIDRDVIGEVKTLWCRHFVGRGGDYYFRDWHAERRYSTGLLLQKASHDIDVMHWLSGSSTKRVSAFGSLMVYGDVSDRLPDLGVPRKLDPPVLRPEVWPPTKQRGLNAIIDVEDVSLVQMQLENGGLMAYQQCHFTPDYWRNYTVIGTHGRLENVGNGEPGTAIHVWRTRKVGWAPPDDVLDVPSEAGGHYGADPRIVGEFLDYVRDGGETTVSAVAARQAVATGWAATESIRSGGAVVDVPPLDRRLRARFAGNASAESDASVELGRGHRAPGSYPCDG